MAIYHTRDNSVKLILGNHELFVEFLRDFIPIDLLKDIHPDDIEDLTERFLPLFQDGQDSDTVKRINLKGKAPLFVIAIVEHESKVNFRSSFKMLQYICLVLDNYEKEVNQETKGISSTKDFHYPPVLPVVFYDGPGPWTAELNFLNRTDLNEVFHKYIPKFEYELVDLKRYTQEDIIRFNDTLSLIMLIDQLKTHDGNSVLSKIPREYFTERALKIPENLRKVIDDVITVLLDRLDYPEETIREVTMQITGKEGYMLFDGFVNAVKEERRIQREEGREEGRVETLNEVLELLKQGYRVEELEAKLSSKIVNK
ncbi:Rpn family recombination-promoting nuclease/putative transposase [Treponema primitia]|uniref:Rpn family recombination-promoting nuclease/putative transposase n=1 Tax=Treponema primitia TaxID=88058 RepID=UPI0039802A97